MTIRDWVSERLLEEPGFPVNASGEHGISVVRRSRPEGHIYCPEPSDNTPFTAEDLKQALREIPRLQFVVVIRRQVANDVYSLADEQGVGVGGLRELRAALVEVSDLGTYKSSNRRFVAGRFDANDQVQSWRRRGQNAYELDRKSGRRNITIVTTDRYEVTSDEIYLLLGRHGELKVDAIVSTNPNCNGFSPTALQAGRDSDTRVMTFRDFLRSLRDPWD